MKRFFLSFSLLGCLSLITSSFAACKDSFDYLSYLSENRSNVLVAEGEDYRLKIYAVDKEYPYSTDGFVGDVTSRAEMYLTLKNGGDICHISFPFGGNDIHGEMSYDNVTGEYFLSYPVDLSEAQSLSVSITHGEKQWQADARTVKSDETLSAQEILSALVEKSKETFTALTKEKNFEGEIYLRLIYESAPYYYVGVTGRDKKTTAFLLDAVSGEILATKHN